MFDPMLIERYKAELLRYARKAEPDASDGSIPDGVSRAVSASKSADNKAATLPIPSDIPIPPFPSESSDATRFLREHPNFGLLRVQVTDSRGSPVSDATVAVVTADSGEPALCAVPTDGGGVADGIALPANPGGGAPFARYDIAVAHPRYEPAHFSGVAIFCGVKSIQQAQLTLRKSIDKAGVSAV